MLQHPAYAQLHHVGANGCGGMVTLVGRAGAVRRLKQVRQALRASALQTMPLVALSSGDSDVLIASRSRWGRVDRQAAAVGSGVCQVASLLPLDPALAAQIEACAPEGLTVHVRTLGALAEKQLRTRSQPASEDEAEVAAAVAEIDQVLGEAEVLFGAFWDTVPGSTALGTTRFPPGLQWLCVAQAGASQVGRWLQEENKKPESLFVTNVSGIHARWIGEWVLGLMGAHCMRLPTLLQQQSQAKWQKIPSQSIRGSTVLVIGLGAIGEEVSRLCRAFGATVLGTRRNVAVAAAFDGHIRNAPCDELHPASALHDLLPRADFVVLATPGTADTEALIGAPELALMQPTSALINVSRGATVDFAALETSLRAPRGEVIAACYSDVAPEEPLPSSSHLWGVPNLYITPHNSGNPDGLAGTGPRYMEAAVACFCAQLRLYLRGEKVFNTVDNTLGY